MIDQLLEKYLTGFKTPTGMSDKTDSIVDVYKNPTPNEIRSVGSNGFRFIADSKTKTLYIWGAWSALHQDAWRNISKEIGDSRRVYMIHTLLPGTVDPDGSVYTYGVSAMQKAVVERMAKEDWSFISKYVSSSTMEKLNKEIYEL
jgi:hypothetical protein